mmetsp:Transcript_60040/g.105084  ORF Transcript_60040/g.105084 Transcript_60040/m.105084 type:complete len:192 (+) Transcript_60040:68-643(+)
MCNADSIRDESPRDGVDGGAQSASTNAPETSISCANCGIVLSAAFRFCTECGAKVGDSKAPSLRTYNKVYDSEDASSVSDDGLSSATPFVPMMTDSTYQDAGMFMAGLPYSHCVHPVQAVYATPSTPLKSSAPIFVPSHEAMCSTSMPAMNEVLHGVLEEVIAPGVMTEMRKSTKSCEELLLMAMPDHYDD